MDWEWKIPLYDKQKQIVDYALVDADVFEQLIEFRWHLTNGYAASKMKMDGKMKSVLMHRFIMDAQKGQIVDHTNQHKIDNRCANLCFVTRGQNAQNVPLKFGTSVYRG